MDSDAAVVQQHPGAAAVALTVQGILVGLLMQHLLHVIHQSVDLGVGRAGGDDEILCQSGQLTDLQRLNFLCLLVCQCAGCQQSQFLCRFHLYLSLS